MFMKHATLNITDKKEDLRDSIIIWASESFSRLQDDSIVYPFDYDVIKSKVTHDGKRAGLSNTDIDDVLLVVSNELKSFQGSSMRRSAAVTPPKPMEDPGANEEWVLDSMGASWVKQLKKASLMFNGQELTAPVKTTAQNLHEYANSRKTLYAVLDKITASLDFDKIFKSEDYIKVASEGLQETTDEELGRKIEAGDTVTRLGSQVTGRVIKHNTRDSNYKVRWSTGDEMICWKQEITKV